MQSIFQETLSGQFSHGHAVNPIFCITLEDLGLVSPANIEATKVSVYFRRLKWTHLLCVLT